MEAAKRRQEERAAAEEEALFEQMDGYTMEDDEPKLEEIRTGQKFSGLKRSWFVKKELGKGAFGAVYLVHNRKGMAAAMKVEVNKEKDCFLKLERSVLDKLSDKPFSLSLMDEGRTERTIFLIMPLLGPSLQTIVDVLNAKKKKMDPATVLRVAIRCLCSLKELHDIGFLHRDIKPDNFCVERCPKYRTISILDFGMAREFAKKSGGSTVFRRPRETAPFRGNFCFAARGQHSRRECNRRDDLEAWFFMAIDLLAPVPWHASADERIIENMKLNMSKVLEKSDYRPFRPIWPLFSDLKTTRPPYLEIGEVLLRELQQHDQKLSDPWAFEHDLLDTGKMEMGIPVSPSTETVELALVRQRLSRIEIGDGKEKALEARRDFVETGKPVVQEALKKRVGGGAKPSVGVKERTSRRHK